LKCSKTRKTAIIKDVAKKMETCNLELLLKGILRKGNVESGLPFASCHLFFRLAQQPPSGTGPPHSRGF